MSSNHVKYLKGRSGIPVVERVVLKWSRVIKPPVELWSCYMSSISASGDIAIAVSKMDDFDELMLFNNNGKIVWSKRYDDAISNPQLSDDGNTIAVQVSINTLTAYDKRGKLLWTYSVEKEQMIKDYKLSRDGRYVVISVSGYLSGYFILLRDGVVEWVKSSISSIAGVIAISPNNAYIVSTLYDRDKNTTCITLYTIDGAELWSTVVKGFPLHVDVSDNGEVLLTTTRDLEVFLTTTGDLPEGTIKLFFIAGGRVLWDKTGYSHAQFTRNGDKIVASSGMSVDVFDREGELLWKFRGAFRFAVSDNYYVLGSDEDFVLVSTKGKILQRIKISKIAISPLEKIKTRDIEVKISPDGRYFAVGIEGYSEGEKMCHLYFFENRDFLIRDVKEKLLKEIDELIKR